MASGEIEQTRITRRPVHDRAGFTLVELVAAMAILGGAIGSLSAGVGSLRAENKMTFELPGGRTQMNFELPAVQQRELNAFVARSESSLRQTQRAITNAARAGRDVDSKEVEGWVVSLEGLAGEAGELKGRLDAASRSEQDGNRRAALRSMGNRVIAIQTQAADAAASARAELPAIQ